MSVIEGLEAEIAECDKMMSELSLYKIRKSWMNDKDLKKNHGYWTWHRAKKSLIKQLKETL